MEREPETTAQREPGEDMEDIRDDDERGEQQADSRTDDDDIVEDEEETSYESDDREASLGEAGLMD
jgi:hypothetical protein